VPNCKIAKLFRADVLKLLPAIKTMHRQVQARLKAGCPHNVAYISIDGGSGYGKTTVMKLLKIALLQQGIDCEIYGLDAFLKDRPWRMAIQKKVTGRELSPAEKSLLSEEELALPAHAPYLFEEDFSHTQLVADFVREIDAFRRGEANTANFYIESAYDQETRTYGPVTVILRRTGKRKVFVIEGKYANAEPLVPCYDLRYRLYEDSAEAKARFVERCAERNATEAEMQAMFYDLALVPSFDRYAERTERFIDHYVNMFGPAWMVVANNRRELSCQAI
jgi:uridine kinase